MLKALTSLHEAINNDPLLKSANLEPHLIDKSLASHNNNVSMTTQALTNYAKWHKVTLGDASKRISIAHIHAFLLSGIYQPVPNTLDKHGNPVIIFRANKDRAGKIPKLHVANTIMFLNYKFLRENPTTRQTVLLDLNGYKLSTFRPSNYKAMLEANLSNGTPWIPNFVHLNSSSGILKFYAAVKRISKDAPYEVHFIDPKEVGEFVDPRSLPQDFGGLLSAQDAAAGMEEFIKQEYAREGLRYQPIDVDSINWKTYKVLDLDIAVCSERMSVDSNISDVDFDKIDAQLQRISLELGLGSEE
ncbi:UNVERIFIED_CONTAM: hypothetical protein HDU68_004074 [Siphonaria sp. JEL0065]|nr:hypothetical protein HDU68_004074 [Siphonaria sp. JEL0065]